MSNHHHVMGVYRTREGAALAVQRIMERGIPRDGVSVIVSEEARDKWFAIDSHSRAAEGAAVGGITGGALGAIALGLTAAGAVVVPGIGILVAGPLLAALAGAGAGGAAGTALGGLIGLGLKEHEVKSLGRHLKDGCVVVGAQLESKRRAEEVEEVLEDTGAIERFSLEGRRIVA
jgi:hypothetical protein